MKILFLTQENLNINTGGVLYAKQIIKGLKEISNDVIIISNGNMEKNDNNKEVFFKRTIFRDLLSRLFMQPSFMITYILNIYLYVKNVDVLYVHGSRDGTLIFFLKRIFPKLKIISSVDNVESDLVFGFIKTSSLVNKIRFYLEFLIRRASEKLTLKYSSRLTFITLEDKKRLKEIFNINVTGDILPICIDNEPLNSEKFSSETPVILFTGSFLFEPNYIAARKLLSKFTESSKFDGNIIIAGRGADKLNKYNKCNNIIEIKSDLSNDEMRNVFLKVNIYLSPLEFGSGMKTKIAEALSYDLCVLGTKHSFIGYENILNYFDVLYFLDENYSAEDIFNKSNYILSNVNKGDAFNAFQNNFSICISNKIISDLVYDS